MATIKITKDNFEAEVLQAEKPVLVDFWAVWCGPCQMVGPVLEEISEERDDLIVGKVRELEFNSYDASQTAVIEPYDDISSITAAAVVIDYMKGSEGE